MRGITTPDPLDDYERDSFTHDGSTREVLRLGEGPAVIVVHELPGLTPEVAGFGRRVAAIGCSAVLPVLFGDAGRPLSPAYVTTELVRACISREFAGLRAGVTSPVTGWLRALARHEHARAGGPGVGAVGMCFTGNVALAMMIDDEVVAPVLSQPSLPLLPTRRQRADAGVSEEDLARARNRVAAGTCVLGLRFTHDPLVPAARFDTLRRELGDGFIAVEIDSSPGNRFGIPKRAHSVLTNDLVDEPGHPTRDALDQVLGFFRERLLEAG